MDSEDVQNFLNATERGIDVQLFVRKNKDDKISKEFYYLGRVIATGNAKQFVMPNTDKTAVEILGKVFPERKICPIPARDILLGGGNIHCITQQIPSGIGK